MSDKLHELPQIESGLVRLEFDHWVRQDSIGANGRAHLSWNHRKKINDGHNDNSWADKIM